MNLIVITYYEIKQTLSPPVFGVGNYLASCWDPLGVLLGLAQQDVSRIAGRLQQKLNHVKGGVTPLS